MPRTLDVNVGRLLPDRTTLLWAGLLVNTEIGLTLAYLLLADVTVTEPRFLVYPFVWLNVSLWALVRTTPNPGSVRAKYLGAVLAGAYFLLLAYAGGVFMPGVGEEMALGWRIAPLPPGWGPALLYSSDAVNLALMPYKVAGYATLAYLVYATVVDAAGSAVSGLLGLASCVSCTWPVLATLLTGVLGSGSAVAAAANEWSYAVGTGVFVLTVALLYWRPTIR
ncbi:DUF7546 family protein [Halorussus litoreus]|uniref:DUF7546 family protein n=1 Tax=Halorussus litoreus TaxID=1710536 RepID=UPI000E22A419|nr:hypothetical protein [Halorussus litoreus]